MDHTIKIWDIFNKSQCVATYTHQQGKLTIFIYIENSEKILYKGAVKDVQWHKDGNKILSCGFDKNVLLTDLETGTIIQVIYFLFFFILILLFIFYLFFIFINFYFLISYLFFIIYC